MRRRQVVPTGSAPMVRLMARCEQTESGCWLWTGDTVGNGESNQYGRMRVNGKIWRVHRLAYVITNGSIPEGLVIDHLCRNQLCFNPSHLEAVPQYANVMRGSGVCAVNARKTSCRNGHAFTAANTYVHILNGRPKRYCRTCGRNATRRHRAQS